MIKNLENVGSRFLHLFPRSISDVFKFIHLII